MEGEHITLIILTSIILVVLVIVLIMLAPVTKFYQMATGITGMGGGQEGYLSAEKGNQDVYRVLSGGL
jgi:hypothetical protein